MGRPKTGQVYVELHLDHFDVRIDLPDGTRSRRKCLAPTMTRSEARAEAEALKAYAWAHGGTSAPAAAPLPSLRPETLDAYAERWAASRRDQAETRQHLRLHILPTLGALRPIASITRADVERFVRHLDDGVAAEQMAAKTAQNIFGTLTKMFDDACNAKRVELRALADKPDPTDKVRGPDRGEEKQSSWLFPREAAALLACAEVPAWWRRVYAFALYTGLRCGEIAVLRVGDVVLDAGYLSVHKARDRVTGGTKSTKGKKSRRVPIEPSLRPLLATLVEGRDGAELLLRTPKKRSMADVLRKHLLVADLEREELHARDAHRRPLTLHDLRHTYSTWLALRGESELVIQSRLGHADAQMTQKYIEAAEAVGHGDVGQPFGPLPQALGINDPSDPSKRSKAALSTGNFERETGFEPATLSLGS